MATRHYVGTYLVPIQYALRSKYDREHCMMKDRKAALIYYYAET